MIAHRVRGYGAVIMTNSDTGGRLAREMRDRISHAYAWDMYDKPIPR